MQAKKQYVKSLIIPDMQRIHRWHSQGILPQDMVALFKKHGRCISGQTIIDYVHANIFHGSTIAALEDANWHKTVDVVIDKFKRGIKQ